MDLFDMEEFMQLGGSWTPAAEQTFAVNHFDDLLVTEEAEGCLHEFSIKFKPRDSTLHDLLSSPLEGKYSQFILGCWFFLLLKEMSI